MKILIGCEESQAVTIEFRKRGFEAYSCDIDDCSGGHPEWHIKDDIRKVLKMEDWYLGIFFTPCTFSSNSGVRWMYNEDGAINRERMENMFEYAGMLRDCLNSDIPYTGCENPIPHKWALGVIGRKYDQIINPWQFGHGESKQTCLWLKNLPLLNPTNIVEGREQKMWKLPPSEDRAKLRSKTYPGIADAMAEQWGKYLLEQRAIS